MVLHISFGIVHLPAAEATTVSFGSAVASTAYTTWKQSVDLDGLE